MRTIKDNNDAPTFSSPGIDPRRTAGRNAPVKVYGDLYCDDCGNQQAAGGCEQHREPIQIPDGASAMNAHRTSILNAKSSSIMPKSSAGARRTAVINHMAARRTVHVPTKAEAKPEHESMQSAASVLSKKVKQSADKKGKSK